MPDYSTLERITDFLAQDDLLSQLPLTRAFYAGGAVRDLSNNRTPKDYDIFFGNEQDVEAAKVILEQALTTGSGTYRVEKSKFGNYNLTINSLPGIPIVTPLGTTRTVIVQFITMLSGSPTDVISRFDFTCNMCWYMLVDGAEGAMYVSPSARTGSALEMCPNIHRPVQALFRIQKFVSMGYIIPGNTLVTLINKISATGGMTEERVHSELGFCVSGGEDGVVTIQTIETPAEVLTEQETRVPRQPVNVLDDSVVREILTNILYRTPGEPPTEQTIRDSIAPIPERAHEDNTGYLEAHLAANLNVPFTPVINTERPRLTPQDIVENNILASVNPTERPTFIYTSNTGEIAINPLPLRPIRQDLFSGHTF